MEARVEMCPTSSFSKFGSSLKLASEIRGFWDKTTFFAASGLVERSRLKRGKNKQKKFRT
jgi:hypothetical protein